MPVHNRFRRPRLFLEALETRTTPSASAIDSIIAKYDTINATATSTNSGLTPSQIRTAYGISSLSETGAGQTIAIVVAYDDPNIASDLKTFDAAYGLSNPTLTKINLGNSTSDPGWSQETALDVEWAHAVAPQANIVLVEAASDSLADLLKGVDAARNAAGVSVVSMSWGSTEFQGETSYDSHFTTPAGHIPVAFVSSAGDDGAWYGPSWPATAPTVLAVGGTTLYTSSSGAYEGETAWYGSGGGYSNFETEPSYQNSVQHSGVRTTPDVSYVADPYTGVAVYDSVPDENGNNGWAQIGGTSAGTPQWAGLIALTDQGLASAKKATISNAAAAVYTAPASAFDDVAHGSNGYRARVGYDLVTGRGSPDAAVLVPYLVTGTTPTSAATKPTTTKPSHTYPQWYFFGSPFAVAAGSTSSTSSSETTADVRIATVVATATPGVSTTGGTSTTVVATNATVSAVLIARPTAISTAQPGSIQGQTAVELPPADDDTEVQTTAPAPAVNRPATAAPAATPAAAPAESMTAEPPMIEARATRPEAGMSSFVRRSWTSLAAVAVAFGAAVVASESRQRKPHTVRRLGR